MQKQLTLSGSLGTINCYKTDNENVFCSLDSVTTMIIVNKTNSTVYVTSNVPDQKINDESIEMVEPNVTKEIICRRLIGGIKDLLFTTDPKLLKKMSDGHNGKINGVYQKITNEEKVYIIQKGNELVMVKRVNSLNRLKSAVITKKSI